MSNMTSLTRLYLSNNNIATLPDEILYLPLQELDLAHNSLTSLPDDINKLNKLQKLNINNNKIDKIPQSIK